MIYVLYTIHIVVSLFLIMVVLLQQGKGADLSVFGGGSTQSAFGARGAATLLHKLTVIGFVTFIVTTMTLGLMSRAESTGSSVMSEFSEENAEAGETGTGDSEAGETAPATDSAPAEDGSQPATDGATPDAGTPASDAPPAGDAGDADAGDDAGDDDGPEDG